MLMDETPFYHLKTTVQFQRTKSINILFEYPAFFCLNDCKTVSYCLGSVLLQKQNQFIYNVRSTHYIESPVAKLASLDKNMRYRYLNYYCA